jgi:hypothetical protein
MRVITLWQPYASLIAWGLKRFETRSWEPTPNQLPPDAPLLIHAAKRKPKAFEKRLMQSGGLIENALISKNGVTRDEARQMIDNIPYGAIVAATRFVDVHPTEGIREGLTGMERAFGNYKTGRFAWELCLLSTPPHPIEATGGRQIWYWNPTFIRVDSGQFVFGVEIEGGIVSRAAPVAKKFVGQPVQTLIAQWPGARFEYSE